MEAKVKRAMVSKKGFLVDTTVPAKFNEYNYFVDIDFSDNIHIQIYKDKVAAIWEQNIVDKVKQTVLLGGNSKSEIDLKIQALRDYVYKLLDDALDFIIDRYDVVPIGSKGCFRGENWTRSKHFIDKLPKDCILHEEHFKNVYPHFKGIEVISGKNEDSVEKFTQLIHNEIILDFAPLIAEELKVNRLLSYDVPAWCEANIKAVSDVFKFPFIKALPKFKRLEVTSFLFYKFGGVS